MIAWNRTHEIESLVIDYFGKYNNVNFEPKIGITLFTGGYSVVFRRFIQSA